MRYALLGLLSLELGCKQFLTVAPEQIQPKQVRFDENTQNAGIIDCGAAGCLVTSGWMARYKAMEKEFNNYISADTNISKTDNSYIVSYEVSNHYSDMRRAERGP